MNNVSIFTFRKMPVRAVECNGENFFVIRDICNILGWSNPNRELAKHTENVPLYERIRTPGGLQVVRLVPRADVEKLLAANSGHKALLLERYLRNEVFSQAGRGGEGSGAGQSADRGIHFHDAHSHDGTVFRRQIPWRTQ